MSDPRPVRGSEAVAAHTKVVLRSLVAKHLIEIGTSAGEFVGSSAEFDRDAGVKHVERLLDERAAMVLAAEAAHPDDLFMAAVSLLDQGFHASGATYELVRAVIDADANPYEAALASWIERQPPLRFWAGQRVLFRHEGTTRAGTIWYRRPSAYQYVIEPDDGGGFDVPAEDVIGPAAEAL